jgi:hypothetical protein
MTTPDPRWLEILKASGWQTSAMSIASVVVLVLVRNGTIPTDGSPHWIAVPSISAIVFGSLAIASVASAIIKATQPLAHITRWRSKRAEQQAVRNYIPHMTKQDQEIIAYLLHHNQKMFQADQDGGYAAPLISKGIIRISAQRGQVLDLTRVPFAIPDHIWTVLVEQRERFPYRPDNGEKLERHPWAIPWMLQ